MILKALTRSACSFPTLFRPVFSHAQALCISLLDGTYYSSSQIPSFAAECFASVTMVGGRVGSAERWREAMEKAIGSGNKSLDRLLESVDEGKMNY